MRRFPWKTIILSAAILLPAVPDLGLTTGLATGVRPAFPGQFRAAIGIQISAIQTLAPNSLDSLRSLALSGGAIQLTSERQAAQALLTMIASPDVGRLSAQPAVRNTLVAAFGKRNLGRIETIAQRLHASQDAEVQRE